MTQLSYPAAEALFRQLVHIMEEDNGCDFIVMPDQLTSWASA